MQKCEKIIFPENLKKFRALSKNQKGVFYAPICAFLSENTEKVKVLLSQSHSLEFESKKLSLTL